MTLNHLLYLLVIVFIDKACSQFQGHGADCSFEDNFCAFTPSSGEYKWIRSMSGTPTARTGPSETHDGDKEKYYIYTEANEGNEGNTATIKSANIATGKQCVSFWYHAYGEHIGKLEFKLENGQAAVLIVEGDKGNEWHKKYIEINPTSVTQIIFTSTRGNGKRGDLAIDEITIKNGECPEPPSPPSPPVRPAAKPVEKLPPPDITGAVRVGCGVDNRHRVFPKVQRMHVRSNFRDPITYRDKIIECRDIANNAGYELFAVEYYGAECYYGIPIEENETAFKYGQHFNCKWDTIGAEWSFYVYYSCQGKEEAKCKADAPSPPKPPKVKGLDRLGCYKDERTRAIGTRFLRLLPLIPADKRQNVALLKQQVEKCRSFILAISVMDPNCTTFGVQYYDQCFIDCNGNNDQYKKYGLSLCPNGLTGGGWQNMVYRLNEESVAIEEKIDQCPKPVPAGTCQPKYDIDFWGSDLPGGVVDGVTCWVKCSEICKENENCKAWTWTNRYFTVPFRCHLKSNVPAEKPLKNVISGTETAHIGC